MDDFTSRDRVRNVFGLLQGEAKVNAPGKRPLSSMTPTIVTTDDEPFLVIGSPGGPTIIDTVLLIITPTIDHRMSITQALDVARFHHERMPDVISHEPFITSPDSVKLLEAMGHQFAARKLDPNDSESMARYWGDAESIAFDAERGLILGSSDPRNVDAAAIGYETSNCPSAAYRPPPAICPPRFAVPYLPPPTGAIRRSSFLTSRSISSARIKPSAVDLPVSFTVRRSSRM